MNYHLEEAAFPQGFYQAAVKKTQKYTQRTDF